MDLETRPLPEDEAARIRAAYGVAGPLPPVTVIPRGQMAPGPEGQDEWRAELKRREFQSGPMAPGAVKAREHRRARIRAFVVGASAVPTMEQIGAQVGASVATVGNDLKHLGISLSELRSAELARRHADVARLTAEGMGSRTIARTLGLPRHAVVYDRQTGAAR